MDLITHTKILFPAKVPRVEHIVCPTSTNERSKTIKPLEPITPTSIEPKDLDFGLGKDSKESNVYVYSMQAYPHQQDLKIGNVSQSDNVSDLIKESSDIIPPRILQSVHGYFNLRKDHPTRLNLTASWDKVRLSQVLRPDETRTQVVASFNLC